MRRWFRWQDFRPLRATVLLGVALIALAYKLPYVNWRRVAAPVDSRPLMIRQDAKGDGRFAAARSGGRSHRGIDVEAPLNSPVRAIRSGTVIEAGTHRGLGHFVVVEHGRDLCSLYAHLNRLEVRQGQRVRQGHVLGAVGKTGNARHPWIAPHVHLEVLRGDQPIDPKTLGLAVVVPPNDQTHSIDEASLEDEGVRDGG
jgi:murein DD-endopeptidase MepM/ murein hydrolase activator NlpD